MAKGLILGSVMWGRIMGKGTLISDAAGGMLTGSHDNDGKPDS